MASRRLRPGEIVNIRSALTAPFRLSFVDLLAALAIAVLAFGLIIGPVLGQEASPSAEPTMAAEATPQATSQAEPTADPAGSVEPIASLDPEASPEATDASEADPCAPRPTPDPDASPDPNATEPPPENLCPAQPSSNPLDLLAWLFTPIFKAIFLGLAFIYNITGDIGVSIILLTILIRILLIPVFRAQIVSQRRMQMLSPELRAIQAKYKGDRQKISEEQMKLYRDRGVNPASGCLPAVLQLFLLLPMYQVFMRGLNAPDVSAMLSIQIPFTDNEFTAVDVT